MLKRLTVQTENLDTAAAVAISLLVQTAISMLAGCIPLLAPMIADSRGWKADLITFYAPMVYMVGFSINFAVPNLLARFGGMGLSLICLAACAGGMVCVLVDNLAISALSTVGIGLALGMMNPAGAQILASRTSPRTAGTIMAVRQTGVPLGGMLAGAVAPVVAVRYGWEQAIAVFAAGSAMLAGGLLPTTRWLNGDMHGDGSRPRGKLEPIRRLLHIRGMGSIIAAATVFSAALVCLRTFLAVYLVKDLGFSVAVAGLAFSVSQAAGMVGQLGWALLSDRLLAPHATMCVIGFFIAGAGALIATFSGNWSWGAICAVTVVYGAGAAGFVPLVLGEVARRAEPGQVGAVTSAANLFLLGGVVVGPMLFGAMASVQSYSAAFAALSACVLAVSLMTGVRAGNTPIRQA